MGFKNFLRRAVHVHESHRHHQLQLEHAEPSWRLQLRACSLKGFVRPHAP